jgi:tetratricopeptide (TPR) repeat protein
MFGLTVFAIICVPISIGNNAQPDFAATWNANGTSLYSQGKYIEALRAFNNALEFDPSSPQIWYNTGNALYSMGKHDEAIKAYDKVIELDPQYEYAWFAKGKALYYLKKYEEAIQALDKVIELNPQEAEAWYIKNNALKALGRTVEANQGFDKATESYSNPVQTGYDKGLTQSEHQPTEGELVKIPTYRPTFIPSSNSISTISNQLGVFKGPEPILLSGLANIQENGANPAVATSLHGSTDYTGDSAQVAANFRIIGDSNESIPGAQLVGQDGNGANFQSVTDSNGYVVVTGATGNWHFKAYAAGYFFNTWNYQVTSSVSTVLRLQKIDTQQPSPEGHRPIDKLYPITYKTIKESTSDNWLGGLL